MSSLDSQFLEGYRDGLKLGFTKGVSAALRLVKEVLGQDCELAKKIALLHVRPGYRAKQRPRPKPYRKLGDEMVFPELPAGWVLNKHLRFK